MARPDLFDSMGRGIDKLFKDAEVLMDSVFKDMTSPVGESTLSKWRKSAWVDKTKEKVHIFVEVPGCAASDLSIDLADSILTVTANSAWEAQVHRFKVDRSLTVAGITATVKNGLLTIVVQNKASATPAGSVTVSQE